MTEPQDENDGPFGELEGRLLEIAALLDDPDIVLAPSPSDDPQIFLNELKKQAREISALCDSLTVADFEAEYVEDEGGEDESG